MIYKTDREGHVGMFGSERDEERDESCSRTERERREKTAQRAAKRWWR